MSSNGVHWATTKKARIPCGTCGEMGTCTVSPDGTRFKCWKDGGRVTSPNGNGNDRTYATGYVGEAHRQKPKASKNGEQPSVFPTPEAAFAEAGRWIKRGRLVASWSYPGDVARVGRWDVPNEKKQCRPIHRVDDGWMVGDPPGKWPLYRGDEVPAAGTIYVVEGEKCADHGRVIGMPCIASADGSSAAESTDWSPLAGRDVVILPDHDAAGMKYARAVARSSRGWDAGSRL